MQIPRVRALVGHLVGEPSGRAIAGAVALVFLLAPLDVRGQAIPRPNDSRPPSPSPLDADRSPLEEIEVPNRVLPRLKLPGGADSAGLAAGEEIRVEAFRFEGNTALSDAELAQVAFPYTTVGRMRSGRHPAIPITALHALRDDLTRAYVDRGYVSSGAVMPSQRVGADGTFTFQIVEGRLVRIDVGIEGRLRDRYVRSRLERLQQRPVNLAELEEVLQLLQQDAHVETLQAQLLPAERRGQSVLVVDVVEETPYAASVQFSDYLNPTIGELNGLVTASYANITGYGDGVHLSYNGSEGLNDFDAVYRLPLNRWDTTFEFSTSRSWVEVIEQPFKAAGVKTRYWAHAFRLTQPIVRKPRTTFSTALSAEYRRNKSFLFGEGFSFAVGPEDGVSKVAVLRSVTDFVHRWRTQAIALRSTVSWGLPVLGATKHIDPVGPTRDAPDGRFVSWLAQAQWAARWPWFGLQTISRLDGQLSNHALLSLEQFAIGGHSSVRGYRENAAVRDQGVTGSFEVRLPVFARASGDIQVQLAAFVDAGYSENKDTRLTLDPGTQPVTSKDQTLASVGLGVLANATRYLSGELYWGQRLKSVDRFGSKKLQDHGIHFALTARWP